MGKKEIFTDDEKYTIRRGMLVAWSRWLDEADAAESMTTRTIARVIADAFAQEADNYKTKETSGDAIMGTASTAWDAEHGVAPEVPHAGEAG